MGKVSLVLVILFLAVSPFIAQETKKTEPNPPASDSKISSEDAKKENPTKPTAASLAQGKKMYGYDCAMCHGKDGDGKGDLAGDMNLTLKDYRNLDSLKNLSDGEIFYIIRNGKGKMPPEGDRISAEECWNMVNYVRSFAKKSETQK